MKSPLRRLRGFGHHYPKERKSQPPPPAKLDELAEAAQDVEQMRKCYDGLLSAAAATTNSVYEFSEALEEMGSCLLAKNALNDEDDDSDAPNHQHDGRGHSFPSRGLDGIARKSTKPTPSVGWRAVDQIRRAPQGTLCAKRSSQRGDGSSSPRTGHIARNSVCIVGGVAQGAQ